MRPLVRTNKELTNLKQIDNVEDIFLQKLSELFHVNANIRYSLKKLLDTHNNNITIEEIIKLRAQFLCFFLPCYSSSL